MNTKALTIAFLFIAFAFSYSCKKDDFETGNVSLSFSQDTIIFDTVFTTVGSATQVFTVYNNGDKPVKISSLRIAGGSNSNFRLNVDGMPGKEFTDVEIGANDSMWIFAEVTIDPNNHNPADPVIVTDSILFSANGFNEYVQLVAWGIDAYFHSPPPNNPIGNFFLLNCNEVWNKDKPHVIYGYALVDSGCVLTINQGANVHFHPGSGLVMCSSSTLNVNGTLQEKVTFQGDRLGDDYKDIPGQWDRIWLSNINIHTNRYSESPKNCYIKNAIIKNGSIGLLVDTIPDNNPNSLTLELENTIVKNMSSYGAAFRGSRVKAYNCVFANSGSQVTGCLFGGTYKFYHCTFANYWENGNRQDPAVLLNNYAGNSMRPLDAYFGNCIIHGNLDNELGLDSFPSGNQFGYVFDHAIIKVENSFPLDVDHYPGVLRATGNSNDPKFTDIDNNIYELDSLSSAAIDKGDDAIRLMSTLLDFDLNGNPRPYPGTSTPDLGAYERR
jgi:hypothetical protein